jgi:hypothetical protein
MAGFKNVVIEILKPPNFQHLLYSWVIYNWIERIYYLCFLAAKVSCRTEDSSPLGKHIRIPSIAVPPKRAIYN